MSSMMAADNKLHISYDSCCRLCLSDNSSGLKDLFGGVVNSAGLIKRISATLGVKIESSDKITTSICTQCVQRVGDWHTYRKGCVANQTKLDNWVTISCPANAQVKEEPLDEQEESDIEIVESSEDSQPQLFPVASRQNCTDSQDEDDLPPTLTPNHPDEDISIDNNSLDDTNAPILNENELVNGPQKLNNKTCTVCLKTFQTARNKIRHERNIHGVQSSPKNTSQVEEVIEPAEEPPAATDTTTEPTSISESSKIEFAAGLCLQSKSSLSPQSKQPVDSKTLTHIEESYLYKCKVIISVFHSNMCHCHNIVFQDHKRIISHLRASSTWFPPFTCYNCMITFHGRSGKMKHFALCCKLRLENLTRLSELRGRDDNKIRLYHNYKCKRCVCVFAFFEDFCDHVYYDHLESDTQNLCTECQTQFDNFDQLKEHAFNKCYVAHYCDICYVQFPSKLEFGLHCVDKHDSEANFDFFEVAQDFNVLSNIEIANLLLTARNEANAKMEPDEVGEDISQETPNLFKKKEPLDDVTILTPTTCISCDNSYSSYHNMIRHLRTMHKFSSAMLQNSLVCPDCGETHANLYLLVKHRKIHEQPNDNGSNNNTCLTCKESYETSADLRQHIVTAHANLLSIPEDISDLPLKRKRSRSIGSLKCDECGETFGRASELESHRNSHLNFKLYRDSKTQAYRSSLSNEKDFTCEVCNVSFISKQKLNQHAKTHEEMPKLDVEVDDVKPLICKFCSEAFVKQRELYDHIDKNHNSAAPSEVTYPRDCVFCSKTISKAGAYANHILMHKRLIADVDFVTNTTTDETAEKKSAAVDNSNDDESDYHTCKRCFKVFTSRYTLKNHMKLHGITMKTPTRTSIKGSNKSTKVFWCNICHQGCQGEVEFKRHKLEHLAETKEQLTMPNLMIETDAVEEDKPMAFSCDMCTSYFPTKLALRKHKEKHLSETLPAVNHHQQQQQRTGFYCKYCKISFSNSLILNDHMASVHDEEQPRKKLKKNNSQPELYTCSICKKSFTTVGALQSHQGWHKRTKGGKYSSKYMIAAPLEPQQVLRYFCNPCNVGFKDDTSLQLHTLEVHRNVNATIIQQQQPTCVACNLHFTSNNDLEIHMMLHGDQERKPHPCQFCDKCFSRGDTLAAHEKRYHPDQILHRECKCHLCDRVFVRNNSLAIHMKIHAQSVKPIQAPMKVYSCSICQIKFSLPKDLRNHIITTHPF